MKRIKITLLVICGLILSLAAYGVLIEPYWIDVSHLKVENETLQDKLRGKTAVHLSDLHIKKIGRRERQVLKIINEIQPDFIFLTGDYITWNGKAAPALDFLARLNAEFGVWAVMGDYDYSNSRQSCVFCHIPGSHNVNLDRDVRFLRNTVHKISLTKDPVMIGGFDKGFVGPFDDEAERFFKNGGAPSLILSHSPLVFDSLNEHEETLVLSGDTHGGQIPIPGWLWKILGYKKNAKYSRGWFKEDKKQMYVSRGIGTSHWPIRILRRPEVVVLHF